jgi:V/A-type H+-transporting ATPase subunit I
MFFPKAMTEVELIVPAKDLVAVTKVLGSRGSFHQIDSTYLGVEGLGPNTWQEKAAGFSTLERRIQALMQTLSLEEVYSGSAEFDSSIELSTLQAAVDRIEADVRGTGDQLNAEKKSLEGLESQLHQLEPIADLNVDVGALRKSKFLYSVPGIMPADSVSRLETSLSRVPHVFLNLRDDPKKPVVWVLGPRSNSDVIDRAVKSAYLTPLTLPEEFEGTPSEITQKISRAIETSKQKIAELERSLAKLADTHKKELYELWGTVHVNRVMADAIARFGQLRHTYVVVGWVPMSNLESLMQRLKQASKEILIEVVPVEPTGHQSDVPVVLQNPGFLGSFETLTTTYARPRYEEIDPTVLIAFTFPLLFGAMFGDAGQGFVLALFGALLVSKIVPALRGAASFGWVIFACGVSATVFGFMYGSIFGFEEILPHHPFFKQFIWIQPLHDPIKILGTTIGVGIVLISFALLLNMYNAWRARDWGRFFFDSHGLAGSILYWSVLALVASLAIPGFPIPSVVFIVLIILTTFVGVVFAHPLKHWMEGHPFHIEESVGMFAFVAFFEVFEKFISMLSNTMSYVRVGAFAIAHGGFSLAIFILARLASGGEDGGVGYWIVVAIGNLGLIVAEGFIVGIQTMRLHYYEFFSKFFLGGGSPYEPLALATAQEK